MASNDSPHRSTWLIAIARRTVGSLGHLRQLYGGQIKVNRLASHNLIHLDQPDPNELQRRLNCLSSGLLAGQVAFSEEHLSGGLDIIFLRRKGLSEGNERDPSARSALDGAGPRLGC